MKTNINENKSNMNSNQTYITNIKPKKKKNMNTKQTNIRDLSSW